MTRLRASRSEAGGTAADDRYVLDPLVAAIYPIPKIALMPLLLLAFGIGEMSKIVLVAIATFFPVLISTYAGAANIENIYLDAAKNFGAGAGMMFREVIFFGALPQIFAGLRLALGTSFLVIVAAGGAGRGRHLVRRLRCRRRWVHALRPVTEGDGHFLLGPPLVLQGLMCHRGPVGLGQRRLEQGARP